jgi:hypothetical protein
MRFGFIDVISLRIDQQHVSATHVAIFRVVRTRIQIELCLNHSTVLKSYSSCLKMTAESRHYKIT